MTTGDRIKQARLAAHLTQKELAEKVGLKFSAIHKYETGMVVNLKRETIAALANALNVKPSWLMCLDDGTDIFSVADFDSATDLLSKFSAAKDAVLKKPPFGLTAEDVQVAYDYHELGQDAKRIVKSIIESEKKAFEVSLAGIIEKQKDKSED